MNKEPQAWELPLSQWLPIGSAKAKAVAPQQPESWYIYQAKRVHRGEIARAIRQGIKVAPEVLADYPDLDNRDKTERELDSGLRQWVESYKDPKTSAQNKSLMRDEIEKVILQKGLDRTKVYQE